MARARKTKSAPNRTTKNLLKALKRNKSMDSQHPSPQNSSPKPVKRKAISANLQKTLSKKRKQVDEPEVSNKQEGLKLLKRGAVTMHRILRRKILGIKASVNFNGKGEGYGKSASEMQSYVGVLARTKIPIWYDSWKRVPSERKTKIWECVQMAFDVPASAKKMVLKSASQKWREFKSRLTTYYVLPYQDQPKLLEFPPADYSFIEKAHWDMFVTHRISDEFLELHNNQKKKRKLNLYPHRMSRRGYANLEQELSQGDPEMEIDRSTTWVLARKDKDGNFKSEEVKNIAENIEKMKEKVLHGEVSQEGSDDVLTKVLGNPEHRGRVRGQGVHVKQSVYFDLPKPKKGRSIDDKIQEGIQRFMAEETSKIVRERDAFWATEMEKLKAALCGKNAGFNLSPNIDSQQGSCSKGEPGLMKESHGVKKKLDMIEDKVFVEEKTPIEHETEVENVANEPELQDVEKVVELEVDGCSEWKLAIGSPTNIVAYATIDTVSNVIHGKALAKENARVSITRAIQGAVRIPFPIEDEIVTVEQALGTYIAWPRDLIVEEKKIEKVLVDHAKKVKQGKKTVGKKMKKMTDCVEEPEYVVNMDANYPPALKRLWVWASDALKDGRAYGFQLCQQAFGSTKNQVLFLSDVHALCCDGEISASIICIYIQKLEEYLKKHNMTDMVAFVDPGMIGAIGCGNSAERSHALAVRFKNAKPGQYFLLPYNHVNHWALTVVNPESPIVYYMDPLKRRIACDEWLEVVDNGIKLYKDSENKMVKKKITWENMAGVPLQHGSTDCGLFLMRYMKEICEDKELSFASKWIRRKNLAYSVDDINEIKVEWASFFMSRHAS